MDATYYLECAQVRLYLSYVSEKSPQWMPVIRAGKRKRGRKGNRIVKSIPNRNGKVKHQ